MFENINSTFQQGLCFLAAGALFGLCYEALRLLRMLFRHHAVLVFIEDTLFFTACGFVSFIIAMWVGIGYFRIYYIAFEVLGACVYFLTAGRLLNSVMRCAVKALKKLLCSVFGRLKPRAAVLFVPFVGKIKAWFVNIAENSVKPFFYRRKNLKSTDKMLYNKKVHSAVQLSKGGESGGVIKAQIRKKT